MNIENLSDEELEQFTEEFQSSPNGTRRGKGRAETNVSRDEP